MKIKLQVTLALIAALSLAATPAAANPPKGETTTQDDGFRVVGAEDEVMNAAVAQARATLSEFLDRLDAGRLTDRDMLKVAFPTSGGGYEHIWVAAVRRTSGGLSGVLANDPVHLDKRRGDPVVFTEAMVSDWSYEARGRLWGNFTTRAVLPTLRSDQAAQLRAILSETPVEP